MAENLSELLSFVELKIKDKIVQSEIINNELSIVVPVFNFNRYNCSRLSGETEKIYNRLSLLIHGAEPKNKNKC